MQLFACYPLVQARHACYKYALEESNHPPRFLFSLRPAFYFPYSVHTPILIQAALKILVLSTSDSALTGGAAAYISPKLSASSR